MIDRRFPPGALALTQCLERDADCDRDDPDFVAACDQLGSALEGAYAAGGDPAAVNDVFLQNRHLPIGEVCALVRAAAPSWH